MALAIKPKPREHKVIQKRIRQYYPWEDMSVGDWFFVPFTEDSTLRQRDGLLGKLNLMLRRHVQPKYPKRKFMAINTGEGVKVWRTE